MAPRCAQDEGSVTRREQENQAVEFPIADYLLFEPPRLCSRNESRSSISAFRPFSWLEVYSRALSHTKSIRRGPPRISQRQPGYSAAQQRSSSSRLKNRSLTRWSSHGR